MGVRFIVLTAFVPLLAIGLTSHAAPAAFESSLFDSGSHCVAYRVRSTSFLFVKKSVIGKNCDVSAQVLPEVGGLYLIEVNIPIRSFSSEDTQRDQDVVKILKAEQRPELTFRSAAHTPDQWRELFTKSEFELDGQLLVGDKSFPIKLNSRYSEKDDAAEVDGMAHVRFEDFGITPPRAGLGLVARVKPEFELHFHFISQRILGADSIRPMKSAQASKGE